MRIRTIKPEFWSHPVLSKKSDPTKLLAIGLLNLADDEGFFFADPRMIRNALRPMDDDSGITTVSLRELSEIGYVSIRNHPTHGEIGYVPSFLIHQVINKPKSSKIKDLYEYGSDTVLIPDSYGLERKGKEQGKERIPPNPQGGISRRKKQNPKTARVAANSPTMVRINEWFSRRPDTLWTLAESDALESANPTEAEMDGMEAFYLAPEHPDAPLHRRTAVITLLNNWPSELDKARNFARRQRGAA